MTTRAQDSSADPRTERVSNLQPNSSTDHNHCCCCRFSFFFQPPKDGADGFTFPTVRVGSFAAPRSLSAAPTLVSALCVYGKERREDLVEERKAM